MFKLRIISWWPVISYILTNASIFQVLRLAIFFLALIRYIITNNLTSISTGKNKL